MNKILKKFIDSLVNEFLLKERLERDKDLEFLKGYINQQLDVYKRYVNIDLLRGVEQSISNSKINEKAFLPFKNIHKGEKIVICGAGPTLNEYNPIKDAIHIAVNRSFLFDKVKFEYIFAQDLRGISTCENELKEYKGNNCIKFFGLQNGSADVQISESFVNDCEGIRYVTDGYIWMWEKACRPAFNLASESIGNFSTIGCVAFQFALWTNPSEIYLVGFDTQGGQHFTGSSSETFKCLQKDPSLYEQNKEDWKKISEFSKIYYPDTEIVSVNPVGLKGIFKDWYQDQGEEPK